MHPVPCQNCGTLFMKHNPNDPESKNCNNCVKKGEKAMTGVQMLITVSPKEQVEIEEYCVNAGVSISDYFLDLHRSNMNVEEYINENISTPDPKDESSSEVHMNTLPTNHKVKKKK